jgi:signal transduction histidine kinase
MDRGYDQIIIFTFISAVLSVSAFVYIIMLKRQYKKLFNKLGKVFDDAANGDINAISYDESVASALGDKIIRYINADKDFLASVKNERNNIKTLISDISHQIRMPVSNLLLYSGLLMEKEISDNNIKQMLVNMQLQSEKLKFLIDVLIKISRLEAGIITVETKSQFVKPLISAAVSEVYPAVIERDIDLSVNIDENLTAVFDIKWTKEAVYNILDNAIKYTDVGGNIKINVIPYEMFIRIDIADNGLGICPDEYTEIFKRFYRSPRTSEYDGVGIGLYLAREIITLQGGYIKVASEVGHGSVFSIYLHK